MKPSPFAPKRQPKTPPVDGVRLSVIEAGIKYKGRADLLLAEFTKDTVVAGTFTNSKTASGAVEWCRRHVSAGSARGLIVNSGNANAFTGSEGEKSVKTIGRELAKLLGCKSSEIFQASTGVIGEPLASEAITDCFSKLYNNLGVNGYDAAANAIMTTDTFPKYHTLSCEIDGQKITLNGIAKGSGMIAPDMATMLSFLFTDIPISAELLQKLLKKAVDKTFNCITVDGDTSTSDTVLIFATGKANIKPINDEKDVRLRPFKRILNSLLKELAHLIIKDGEGISKFVTVEVVGAKGSRAAKKIAMSIANSPLVKTAIAGEDANWGRIVMAVGKAGEAADRDLLNIWIGDCQVTENGARARNYCEEPLTEHMKSENIKIKVDIGLGRGRAKVWTCDLTHDYISINADYRT